MAVTVKQESDLQLGVSYGRAGQVYVLLIPTLPALIRDCSVWLGSPSPVSVGCVHEGTDVQGYM